MQIIIQILFIIFNSKSMPKQGILTLTILVILFELANNYQINLLYETNGNQTVNMYSNGVYNSQFMDLSSKFNCSLNSLFTYSQSPSQNQANSPYYLQLLNVPSNVSLGISTKYSLLDPTLQISSCVNNCTLSIKNNCPSEVWQFLYFDMIIIQVSGLNQMTFNVLCDSSYNTNTFQWGLIIMIVFCTILLGVITIYSRAWSMGGAGIKLNYWLVVAFWIIVIIFGIISEFTSGAIFILLQISVLILGVIGIWICSDEIMFLLKFQVLQFGFQVKELFTIRIMDFISLLIGVGFVVGYAFSNRNWIINDIICICIIIGAIKIIKYTNMKIAIFTLIVGLAVEMAFVWIIHFTKFTSYNDLILNTYNYPFELQLPTINPVYKQKCAWFPFTAIINPGIFMSYLRRFDVSRNTNIYFITAILVFIFGSIVWVFISIGSVHSWPFQIVTGPVMMGLVSVFAYKRREIRTLWEGSFYDQDFANRDGLDQIKDTIVHQQSKEIQLVRDSLLNNLRINARDDSDLSSLKAFSINASPVSK